MKFTPRVAINFMAYTSLLALLLYFFMQIPEEEIIPEPINKQCLLNYAYTYCNQNEPLTISYDLANEEQFVCIREDNERTRTKQILNTYYFLDSELEDCK